ncbi:hypothetical protein GCM10011507_00290 [Edaphobacter acidisoli]|uniref:PEP-CTERM protein-sorting domain-containing protein n=1 Tax=Edaphobacter acidisoli TaxID=2040573 RepID=A0A916REH2_9BACT|nr:hypothetical protein [Edaphobacter acidisoli]GGA53172.1 hypothetical protein GCM10011507_00290 [Edaphobacter acidisoli]
MSLKTLFLIACAALVALFAPVTLSATPFTYALTLTPDLYSSWGGTGVLTLASAPSANGVSVYSERAGTLQDVSFAMDGETFTMAENTGDTIVRFIDGQLDDIVYSALVGSDRTLFMLDTTNVYGFFNIDDGIASFGTISARPENLAASSSAPVSEPASLFLFGTGLFLSIGLLYRMNSPRFSSKVHQPEA